MSPTDQLEDLSNAPLFRELQWVHGLIRRDLETCKVLAHDIANGTPPTHIQAQLQTLQTRSPLWQLRVNCLYYCRFVHGHHGHEDALLFPVLRRVNADLNPVVDKLEADHRKVSDYLDDVEAAANALLTDDSDVIRARLIQTLEDLAETLLAHLDYEEAAIGPTLATMSRWDFTP